MLAEAYSVFPLQVTLMETPEVPLQHHAGLPLKTLPAIYLLHFN